MTVLSFDLIGQQDKNAVESDMALALFAAECVYGRPRVRLEASYLVANDGSGCVLRAKGAAGEAAARIFAGLTAARLGEAAYEVRRVAEMSDEG